jgi:hypothetical protein
MLRDIIGRKNNEKCGKFGTVGYVTRYFVVYTGHLVLFGYSNLENLDDLAM